ncbi:MAG: glycosyltransferase 87 family protein, partial [Myxococcota bacterium]
MKNTLHRVCCGAYVLLSAELYLVAGLPPGSRGTATVLVYAGLTLLMFAVWRLEKKHQVDSGPWVLGAALLARAVTFFVPGFLSHDIDRYLWDGAVALEGLDPYSVAAEDPLLIELRSRWPTPEEHLQYPTLYPPLALTLFAGCAAMGPEFAPWGWRLLVLAASVVILLAARRLSEQLENRSAFVFVAFSPLLLVEGQVGAHLDLFVAAAVAVALLALAGGRPRSGTTALALGAAIKLLPAGALGVWWVRRGVRRSLGLVAIAAVLFLGPYLAAFLFGWVPVGSISVFFEKWRFASPLWLGLEGVFGERMGAVAL